MHTYTEIRETSSLNKYRAHDTKIPMKQRGDKSEGNDILCSSWGCPPEANKEIFEDGTDPSSTTEKD